MFVTDRFVFIHQPKTGGTFVTTLLTRLHEARGDEVRTLRLEPGADVRTPAVGAGRVLRILSDTRQQHGARADIPPPFRDRPVLATIRNPYDRYVSQFAFAWWRRYPGMFGPVDEVRRAYPHFPDLRFKDFVELTDRVSARHRCADLTRTPGFHTQQLIEFLFRDPDAALSSLCEGRGLDPWVDQLGDVHFLDQARLNVELHRFLLGAGYAPDEIHPILTTGHIWPPEGGRPAGDPWQPYYTPALKAFVRERERLLFQWFPQFDV